MNFRKIQLKVTCPNCGKDPEIEVEYESPSDYIYDYSCNNCNFELDHDKIDKLAEKGVANWLSNYID